MAAVLVWNPLPVLAAVIKIQHGSDRVNADSVDMIFFKPEYRAGNQKADHLVAPVVKYKRSPLLVFPFARVAVFVARRAVKPCKPGLVLGKMSRHPVHDNADARLVALFDETHKFLRFPVARSRGEISRHLIPPRAVERMLRDRHQFNVRVTHIFYIRNQFVGKLVIGKNIAVQISPPGAHMQFVNIHRLAVVLLGRLVLHPRGVAPVVALNVIVFGCVARAGFKMIGIGVAFKCLFPIGAYHTKFIRLILLHYKGKKALPDTVADFVHGIYARLPGVEIPDNGNLLGIWRPHAADHTLLIIHYSFMCPHKFVCFYISSLVEQIKRQISVI